MPNTTETDDRISMRTPPDLKRMLVAAAAVSNISMTDFLLNAARKAAEVVLAESRQITLNQQEWDRFMDLLDNPPPPNAALRAAMQRHQALLD